MTPGAALELAITNAAQHYMAVGRGELAKQHTPRAFAGQFTAGAPVDFKGWHLDERGQRAPLYLEAKHTTHAYLAFDDKGIDFAQLDAMRDAVKRRVHMLLVVDVEPAREVYVVDAREVVEFAAVPWRSSLSLDWLQARGEVAKVSAEPDGSKRRVWFLDCAPHPDQFHATLRMMRERADADGKVVEIYPARRLNQGKKATTFRELLARKPGHAASDAEIIAWRNEFSEWELERSLAEAKRTAARAPVQRRKRGWMGGR